MTFLFKDRNTLAFKVQLQLNGQLNGGKQLFACVGRKTFGIISVSMWFLSLVS